MKSVFWRFKEDVLIVGSTSLHILKIGMNAKNSSKNIQIKSGQINANQFYKIRKVE